MLNGDLSNRVAPTILIRVGDTLIKENEKRTLKDKILGKNKYIFDPKIVNFIYSVLINSNRSVDLLISTDRDFSNRDIYYKMLVKEDLPCNKIRFMGRESINIQLNMGLYVKYIDESTEYRNFVGHKDCCSIETYY